MASVPCRRGVFIFSVVLAAYAARGKAGPVMGLRPLLGPPCIPPEAPLLGLSCYRDLTRAARLLLRELPRCARRSPCAPRNASVRLRVE
ncbi:hypothetical protein KL86DES1_20953 [uncultured Desulfovibrio sp.]|uniref:Uncharacterized protein n=1 Tax=uncultured Desulfovibrio sp. TaxID=167968 RepID=A0A212L618_9BACT|nr:hypothetical protein KL86DES1_20953 [uncultured Desulfovibrio sp.]VZH33856.1 conserved protein of unknown function [Desulfovibrio sp. 86]